MKVRSLAKRNWLGALILMVLACGVAGAESSGQPAPNGPPARAEFFGGFSFERLAPSSGAVTSLASGWAAGMQVNLRGPLALVADFSGAYGTQSGVELRQYNFLAGPRLTLRRGRAAIFAHVLPGMSRLNARAGGAEDTASAFAAAAGGGLDVRLSRRVGLRLVQADYLVTRLAGNTQNNLRLSSGVVIYSGQVH